MSYLSYSQINMFLRCGQSYKYRYIDGKIVPPSIALIKGKSCHVGIEENNVQKIITKKDLSKDEIIQASVDEYEKTLHESEIKFSEDEQKEGKTKIIGKTKDSIVSISELYSDEVAPNVQPIYAEKRVEFNIDGINIVSIIDCIDDKNSIRDYKITGRSKNQNDVDSSLQLDLYAIAYYNLMGKLPKSLSFDCLVEKKEPVFQRLETQRKESVIAPVSNLVVSVNEAIQKGVFLPASPDSWACSKRWCGYYSECKYKGKVYDENYK